MLYLEIDNLAIYESDIVKCDIQILRDDTALTLPISNCNLLIKMDANQASHFVYNKPFSIRKDDHKYQFYCKKIELQKNDFSTQDIHNYTIEGMDVVGILAQQDWSKRMYYNERPQINVLRNIMGNLPFTYDPMLEVNEIMGYIGHCSRREALRHFLQASNTIIELNEDGNLHIRPFLQLFIYDDMGQNILLPPDKVLNTVERTLDNRYSKISCDEFQFSLAPFAGENTGEVNYNGTNYYYIKRKKSQTLPFPTDLPDKELYVQDEMLVATKSMYDTEAMQVISKMTDYYNESYTLKLQTFDKRLAVNNRIGIEQLNMIGRPTKIDIKTGTSVVNYELGGIYHLQPEQQVKLDIIYYREEDPFTTWTETHYAVLGSDVPTNIMIEAKQFGSDYKLISKVSSTKAEPLDTDLEHYQDEDYYYIKREILLEAAVEYRLNNKTLYVNYSDAAFQTGNTLGVYK